VECMDLGTINPETLAANNSAPRKAEVEVSMIDLAIVIAKSKGTILRWTAAATVLAVIVAFLLPSFYTATAKILIPQNTQSSASALLAQVNPFAASMLGGLKTSGEVYVAMLKSRTVADNIINSFELQKLYGKRTLSDTRTVLGDRTTVDSGKESVITISVEDRDPNRAAELANAYVSELYKMNQTLAVTEASQRRLFYEQQLRTAKDNLANAEVALRKTQESTGLIQLDEQAKAIIHSAATLKGQIAAKEVELQRMRLFATDQNADLLATQQELVGLKRQLALVEERTRSGRGDIQIATANVPEAGLEYVRKLRDAKYYETLFEALAKQYEAAKLDESKSASIIQVIDRAIAPDKRSFPPRAIVVLVGSIIGFILSVLVVIGYEVFARLRGDPEFEVRLQMLKAYLTL
jgi:tyrosine-protein kinase Etk/Wzc